jgi:hypothetical protein
LAKLADFDGSQSQQAMTLSVLLNARTIENFIVDPEENAEGCQKLMGLFDIHNRLRHLIFTPFQLRPNTKHFDQFNWLRTVYNTQKVKIYLFQSTQFSTRIINECIN